MSTPNPFTIDREHWALINTFVGMKANEDGVSDLREQTDLMRQYWLLLVDKAALKTEVEAMELDVLEAAVVNTRQAVVDQEQEIADRKAGNPPPRLKPEEPEAEPAELVIPEIFNAEVREAAREAERIAAEEAEADAAAARRAERREGTNFGEDGEPIIVNDDDPPIEE